MRTNPPTSPTETVSDCCGKSVKTELYTRCTGCEKLCTTNPPTETGKRQKCRCYINLKTYGRAASKGGAMRGYKPCPVPGHENNSIPPTETVSEKKELPNPDGPLGWIMTLNNQGELTVHPGSSLSIKICQSFGVKHKMNVFTKEVK